MALISAYVFLGLNGLELSIPETQAVEAMLSLAAGEMAQPDFADLLRRYSANLARSVRRKTSNK